MFSRVLIIVNLNTLADCIAGGKNDGRRLQHAFAALRARDSGSRRCRVLLQWLRGGLKFLTVFYCKYRLQSGVFGVLDGPHSPMTGHAGLKTRKMDVIDNDYFIVTSLRLLSKDVSLNHYQSRSCILRIFDSPDNGIPGCC